MTVPTTTELAGTLNLTIEQEANFSHTLTWREATDGSPCWTVRSQRQTMCLTTSLRLTIITCHSQTPKQKVRTLIPKQRLSKSGLLPVISQSNC